MYTFGASLGVLACSLMLEWGRDRRPCSNCRTFPPRRWSNWHTLCPWIGSCLRADLCWIRMYPVEDKFQNHALNHSHVILVYLHDVGNVEILGDTLEDFLGLERSYLNNFLTKRSRLRSKFDRSRNTTDISVECDRSLQVIDAARVIFNCRQNRLRVRSKPVWLLLN